MMTTLNLDLDDVLSRGLNQVAIRQGKHSVDVVHDAIARHLKDLDSTCLAMKNVNYLEKGNGYSFSFDELDELEDRLNSLEC